MVTRPGRFHRSRYGQAICRKLDLPEMIADSTDDYVTRAIQIATDKDYRKALQEKIHERSHELFEDESAVKQHEQFFLEAIARSRSESYGERMKDEG
jgi:predicted O-linked N-acetylglucosamine transferase (SPINDLY family)